MQDINTIPNVDTNGFWMFNFMSQIVPERDKIYSQLQLHYSKGNYFYFIAVKPIRNALDLSLSKVLRGPLTLSIYVDDVLNSNENALIRTKPSC
jgi:hypothetical protein